MKIPSREECLEILKEYQIYDNVLEHSIVVAEVGIYLAENLKKNNHVVNISLVESASLLHDVAKSPEIRERKKGNSPKNHMEWGYEILSNLGYEEVAIIVQKHALSSVIGENPPIIWEEKIVYYADKRVNHNNIVSLNERIDYIRDRYYGRIEDGVDRIEKIRPHASLLEEEIIKAANVDKLLDALKF